MLHFDSDYMEGAHPAIIERLASTNLEQTPGYGTDCYCASARERIRAACAAPDAEVFFLVGGTQTNAVVLDQLLCPWEGVISAETGHINGHEAGAVEACGHKILQLPTHDGKLDPAEVEAYYAAWRENESWDHVAAPGVVYISHPTESGSLYSLAELEELARICRACGMRLFLDGARLGYGLAAPTSDVTLPDIARLVDAFYIGGTKVGALCGEAAVFTRPQLAEHFFTMMKRRGAVLAKGRLLGLQFDTLFEDDRYLSIGRHAVELAHRLAAGFEAAGYKLAWDSPTNQQFVLMTEAQRDRLREHATFETWEHRDDGMLVMRFVCSWAAREEDVEALLALL